ncbi:MAG TPA: Lrp/AsnC family transcriptional regulator [Candidatus Nanoarchaeia archaeon]|nr:Lrp/AsnC family transcriptional regulator [Candidatus Nanoarchaeia archaeon]
MAEIIDDIDRKIINTLLENSKLSTQKISKKTGIPITTVHHRIKKLEANKIISSYTIRLNNKSVGHGLKAFISVKVDHQHLGPGGHEKLLEQILKNPAVERVNLIAGDIDLFIEARVKDIEEMNQFSIKFLRGLSGIASSSTTVVFEEREKTITI